MTVLAWDSPGERTYQAGIDRGVLYIDGLVSPWNGLIKIEDATPRRSLPIYQDGVKTMEDQQLGEYEGALTAFTYPDLFERALGIISVNNGLNFYDQYPRYFNLSYRTMLGDDIQGVSRGYLIHILYNLYAGSNSIEYNTLSSTADPMQFSWKLTCVPVPFTNKRPTAHLSINSSKITPAKLLVLENMLYGDATGAPSLPTIPDLIAILA